MTPPVQPEDVLGFWFGPLDADGMPSAERVGRWFRPPEGFDDEIRARFGDAVEAALAGDRDAWADTPRGRLALVLLLDQFPRNLFRGRARAFAGDPKASALAESALASGEADRLEPVERTFLLMPLMHAEDLAVQRRCVALYADLAAVCRGPLAELVRGNHEFAERHRVPIERFGRFPSRNAALGRESSPDEQAWLAERPAGF